MDTCQECRERLSPLGMNPSVSQWDKYQSKWLKPICYGCSNYDPEEPAPPQPQEIIHRLSNMGKAEFDLLQQTARKVDSLEKKLAERDIKPKPKSKGLKPIE